MLLPIHSLFPHTHTQIFTHTHTHAHNIIKYTHALYHWNTSFNNIRPSDANLLNAYVEIQTCQLARNLAHWDIFIIVIDELTKS